ncbi:MAG: hypothetical protein JSW04_11515 [Desulfobacterales bacterium]|nr:MAG: hypothetical protein JSW04_11515 [Desulfobacterales bacterium]
MKKNKVIKITVIAFILLGCISSINNILANENLNNLSKEQQGYVTRYVEAINADDLSKLKVLMHSSYLNCINSTNQDYFDTMFQKSLKYDIPQDYTVSIEPLADESVAKEMAGFKQWGLPYPSRPTHQLQIDFNKSEYSSVAIVRKLILEDGKYYEISGCPTREMVKKFRKMNIKKEKERKRAEGLFRKLKDPLLSELTQLLKEGRKIDAWKRYSEVTGESLATAKAVLSHIQTE